MGVLRGIALNLLPLGGYLTRTEAAHLGFTSITSGGISNPTPTLA